MCKAIQRHHFLDNPSTLSHSQPLDEMSMNRLDTVDKGKI